MTKKKRSKLVQRYWDYCRNRAQMEGCQCCGAHVSTYELHHHPYKGSVSAMGAKVSDFSVVPLCGCCHRDWHGIGCKGGSWDVIEQARAALLIGFLEMMEGEQ